MAKEKIKKGLGYVGDFSIVDTHRLTPKAKGGQYVDGNVVISDPLDHMKVHGTYRSRDEQFEVIKDLMDDRKQVQKALIKVENQLLSGPGYTKKGVWKKGRGVNFMNIGTIQVLESQLDTLMALQAERDRVVKKAVREFAKVDPMAKAVLSVKGVGEITTALMLTYVDVCGVFPEEYELKNKKKVPHPRAGQEKAPHASSLWAYVGLDKPARDRYSKGTSSGGNKTLRTGLHVWATVQLKMTHNSPYYSVYENTKARLAQSEKKVITRNTKGFEVEVMWKDTSPGHRNSAAIRKMIKNFLADYWMVGRELGGKPTTALYPEAILGGSHRTIMPKERGWIY